jgi:hypothetical protein
MPDSPSTQSTRGWVSEALIVGTDSSKCGACGRGAFPTDKQHTTLAGYRDAGKPSDCGVVWRYVTSDYAGQHMEDACRGMRPDLEWRPMFPGRAAA